MALLLRATSSRLITCPVRTRRIVWYWEMPSWTTLICSTSSPSPVTAEEPVIRAGVAEQDAKDVARCS